MAAEQGAKLVEGNLVRLLVPSRNKGPLEHIHIQMASEPRGLSFNKKLDPNRRCMEEGVYFCEKIKLQGEV